ncbi:alpha-glucosidase/alpha-galactosidase [Nonomuraea roseoviolacea subsp. roseoviolacea]|uniref:Alpha-galactosidase n=1 Tax=Nonomuraea roseoviolacea subsp. carminata TaxID=160689 RepID=A0ABT1JSC3_9ACTN|nr:alpha-glucosidase/alpha-galactosidase [Nonomuraea roseoviolacea]MCP2344242.1 alpha-galactosidase [Nonomuraea roseoviolacea subsp. carminata]
MARIVFIGAGSVEFTKNVLSDILTFPELGESTLVLHDIDADRLATAEAMATWMVGELRLGAKVEAHLDRRAAVDGADYVINEIAVGGHAATVRDFEIPRRYGLRQTIGDTLGIGGIFRALRTIPVMVGLGEDLAELAPHALLLSYTNPMSMIPRAVYEGSSFDRVVGLCHSVRDTEARLASLVGVPEEEISFVTAGVNHQAFVLTFERGGENLYPVLDQVIANDPELRRTVRVEMYRRLGHFPTESSEHGSEYLPWFLHHDAEVERLRIPVEIYLQWSRENVDTFEETRRRLAAGEGVEIEPAMELASEVIHSIETGTRRIVHGNVRNGGLIGNLPAAACVEVPCVVDRAGMRPTRIGDLPPQLAALNQTFLNVGELTVRAALEGRRDHVYHAAMLDPNTSATLTLQQIHDMVDEMIAAHGALLPEGIR